MQISLQQIKPVFLEAEKIERSEIWNKNLLWKKAAHLHIVAPSGSGKTSLIHFLYQIRQGYSGTLSFDNRDVKSLDANEMAAYRAAKISIVFQDLRLFPDHTVWQNITIKRQLNPYQEKDTIAEMADKLGISNKLDRLARECSYGEQQRIAIIRALQQPFDFILLDEPFSHLDTANRNKALELITTEAQKREASIILADLEKVDGFETNQLYHL
jgi:ABC-type lipoprotein export system ATPase subunit